MEQPAVVSTIRIKRVLELACVCNAPLSITTEANERVYHYTSTMREVGQTAGRNTLFIDIPVTDGPAIALKPGLALKSIFALEDKRYAFDSAVVKKTTLARAGRKSAPALEVAYPNVLKGADRRQHERVSASGEKPIAVECGAVGEVMEKPGEWNHPSRSSVEGRIGNISVGGMLLTLAQDAGRMPVGTELGIRFALAPRETPIVLKGIVRRNEEGASAGEQVLGVEFIETTEEFEYKLAINRLYRYLAEKKKDIKSRSE